MKHRNITIAISRCAIAACLLLSGGSAIAAVADTKHNLGSTSTLGNNQTDGSAQICVFCHTPHGSATGVAVPLWNKTLAVASTYTTYDSLGTTSLDGATAPVGSVSIACLSCHDGTQAMDAVINEPNADPIAGGSWTGAGVDAGGFMISATALLTKDLTNDHPIGIQYAGGGYSSTDKTAAGGLGDTDFNTAEFADLNSSTIWWVDSETDGAGARAPDGFRQKTDMQLYTRNDLGGIVEPFVECASCHDPHSTNATFLRTVNAGSAVCLACHNK